MLDKNEAKKSYKLAEKIGGIVVYKNLSTGKKYIDIAPDLGGAKNRFEFARKTGNGLPYAIEKDAKTAAFEFEVLEELKKDELQSTQAFKEDLKILKEIWLEKFSEEELY
ncbi:GIY-YIG nuclease family protein [Lactococcus protaetiae]|uniref:GIY-YIG nuclease family protein n=1 Tax=Lactococcus protaetiae TaxID=2592653 RepID=A0A514ZB30_9LACT|nr:GIY-YIG nuclease family protein [Lactococcus protaetiae]MCL2113752.1 GIY-YIG nuclease family protein [Streptococcaceae bacterium]QDK71804.1 GIY-YIG nuclease family protein [Lactococcus protaetiae]